MNTKAHLLSPSHWIITGKLLDKPNAEQALIRANRQQIPLVKYLVDQNLLQSIEIADAASRHFSLPLMDLGTIDMVSMPLAIVDSTLIQKHRVLPLLSQGSTLTLGMSDPANESAVEEIKFHTGYKISLVVIEEHKLNAVLLDLLDTTEELADKDENSRLDFNAFELESANDIEDAAADNIIDETPVMRFVNKLLMDAIRLKVSDIHIETFEKFARIRFREDGLLREVSQPPLPVARKIGSRIKVMAKMDIAEKRLPQDGRLRLKISRSQSIDIRVSTLPTLWGEKTVLRILDSGQQQLDLGLLGFSGEQRLHYTNALNKQQGLILVTGPTGSGKSLSLYAGLQHLNTQERNIATAEDPVEIHLHGINQVAVNATIGLDFAETLRAFLRQDPDVLMVGEIRDPETAEIAIRAAQTGHLVMSTLHTNSASETLARLLEMGIAPYNLATSLSLIIAQRLVRRLCNQCKKPLHLPRNVLIQEGFILDRLKNCQLFVPTGCEACHSGYRGRIALIETVPITDALSRVIMEDGNSIQIAEIARKAGFNTLRTSGLEKVAQGLTSLAEINRITWSEKH
ncbi:MAG: type IV-A pilus assembly ATPase PilB [Gammaproteobacteria bacterium]|nr:type IV-A pilus assembly ATPase PilB [Gammaproteobacteria bacterium]